MARQETKKDAVIVGLGWTEAILGMELASEGLEVLALERGPDRRTVPEMRSPQMIDELSQGERHKMMLRPAQSTVTFRRDLSETALPIRKWGSFLLGNGVGGSGVHWNGQNWRPQPEELRLRSYITERWDAGIIPQDMTIADYPVTYDELEPFFDRFERVAGISGIAGNIRGELRDGGNPYEGWRSRDYPMPPLPMTWNSVKFAEAAKAMNPQAAISTRRVWSVDTCQRQGRMPETCPISGPARRAWRAARCTIRLCPSTKVETRSAAGR